MQKILVKKFSKGLKAKLRGSDVLDISENMQGLLSVKLTINNPQSVPLALLSAFFINQLNKKAFDREVILKFSTAEAIAFWQFFTKSEIDILSDLSYWLADCLLKYGDCLYEKKHSLDAKKH